MGSRSQARPLLSRPARRVNWLLIAALAVIVGAWVLLVLAVLRVVS